MISSFDKNPVPSGRGFFMSFKQPAADCNIAEKNIP